MSATGVVSIVFGVVVILSRGFLVISPRRALEWFEGQIQTERRTRFLGVFVLPLAGLMLWAGASEATGLAEFLRVVGFFVLFGAFWLILHPRSYKALAEVFLPGDPGGSLLGWRVAGGVGVLVGAALVIFGWRAL